MSRSRKLLKKSLLGVAAFTLTFLGFAWLKTVASMDAFARLRQPSRISPVIGVRLGDVDLLHYSGSKLVTKARVARVDVRQDRQYLDLYGVTEGTHYSKEGSFKFAADQAAYDANTRRVEVNKGGRVQSDHFDLAVSRFSIQENKEDSILRVPGSLDGRLLDGNVKAVNLTYKLGSGDYSVGPISWVGMLAAPLQDPDSAPKRTRWEIKTNGVMTHSGDIDKWPDGEAKDGEVLVTANLVERNKKTDVITATGKVRYFSAKTNMTCDKAVIFRKEKRAVFTGDVHMYFKPEDQQNQPLMVVEIPPFRPMVPDEVARNRPPAPAASDQDKTLDDALRSGSIKKYPVVSQSNKVEYWYGKGSRHGIITGNPQARQELPGGRWRHVWSPKGLYDGEKETLRLLSSEGKKDTRVKTSLGDDLTCKWFEISTKDEDDQFSAAGTVGFVATDDEDIPKLSDGKKGEKPKTKPVTPAPQPGTPAPKGSASSA